MFGFAVWQRITYTLKYTKFQLIDFIKLILINFNTSLLKDSGLLYFMVRNLTEDGEYIPIVENGKIATKRNGGIKYYTVYKQAYYRGLDFRIYEPTETHPDGRITIEGSLHKYWNNGEHNFNDFGITQLMEVLNDLNTKFGISPENCILKQLEVGVNITPPINTDNILNECLMHKTTRLKSIFTKDEGNYIQTKNQRHTNKFYNKKKHYYNKGYYIENEIMRIEKKYSRMKELNQRGIYTLNDLLDYGLINFKGDLIKMWDNVLYCDLDALKGSKNEYKYKSLIFWEDLKYDNFKYHRNQLNALINKNPNNMKKQISDLIDAKCEILNPTQINS